MAVSKAKTAPRNRAATETSSSPSESTFQEIPLNDDHPLDDGEGGRGLALPISSSIALPPPHPRRSDGSTSHENLLFESEDPIIDYGEKDMKLRSLEDENRKLIMRLEVVEEVRERRGRILIHFTSLI